MDILYSKLILTNDVERDASGRYILVKENKIMKLAKGKTY